MMNDPRGERNALIAPIDAIDVDGERALWMAVLYQAVHDATRTHFAQYAHGSQTSTTVEERDDARAFLSDPERYEPVCELLNLDTDWFRTHLAQREGTSHA